MLFLLSLWPQEGHSQLSNQLTLRRLSPSAVKALRHSVGRARIRGGLNDANFAKLTILALAIAQAGNLRLACSRLEILVNILTLFLIEIFVQYL